MSYPGHSLEEILPLCREAVGVFYCPNRLGNALFVVRKYSKGFVDGVFVVLRNRDMSYYIPAVLASLRVWVGGSLAPKMINYRWRKIKVDQNGTIYLNSNFHHDFFYLFLFSYKIEKWTQERNQKKKKTKKTKQNKQTNKQNNTRRKRQTKTEQSPCQNNK